MVSLRRRKLLGLCTGVHNSFLAPLNMLSNKTNSPENSAHNSNPGSVHPVPFDDLNIRVEDAYDPSGETEHPIVSDFSHSYDRRNQASSLGTTFSKELGKGRTTEPEVKRRKQHRRRRINSAEKIIMRGVYFKNMKWQAAIKVDKKQIHLGTVSSQDEAAHLYDRAAFMCGREPNFDLPEEEKQQLRKLKWDEFIAMTRKAITSKRIRRAPVIGKMSPSFQNSEGLEGSSASDYPD